MIAGLALAGCMILIARATVVSWRRGTVRIAWVSLYAAQGGPVNASQDGSGAGGKAVQQAPGLWRADLQRQDLSISGREVIQDRGDTGPEAPLVRHAQVGEEIIDVLEA